jgi:hypothetical protein
MFGLKPDGIDSKMPNEVDKVWSVNACQAGNDLTFQKLFFGSVWSQFSHV